MTTVGSPGPPPHAEQDYGHWAWSRTVPSGPWGLTRLCPRHHEYGVNPNLPSKHCSHHTSCSSQDPVGPVIPPGKGSSICFPAKTPATKDLLTLPNVTATGEVSGSPCQPAPWHGQGRNKRIWHRHWGCSAPIHSGQRGQGTAPHIAMTVT